MQCVGILLPPGVVRLHAAPPFPPSSQLQLLLLCSGYVPPAALLSAKVFADRDTGEPKGYAFVTLADAAAAQALKAALHGAMYGGRRLVVDASNKSRAPGT